eukprot:scaffold140231_cov21-Tisochrysis_lutea.AAC.2
MRVLGGALLVPSEPRMGSHCFAVREGERSPRQGSVAASTGDMRRALELLRRSAELAEAKMARSGADLSNRGALQEAVTVSEEATS